MAHPDPEAPDVGDVIEFPQQHDQDGPRRRGLRDALAPADRRGFRGLRIRPSGAVARRTPGVVVRRDQAAAVTTAAVRVTWRFSYRAAKGGARGGTRILARVGRGHAVTGRRLWHAASLAAYDEMIRAARATGDFAVLKEWVDAKAAAKRDRHRRMVELPRKVWGLVKVTGIGLAVVGGLVVVVAPVLIAVTESGADAVEWFRGVGAVVRSIGHGIGVAWDVASAWETWAVAGVLWLVVHYALGRDATVPQWAATAAQRRTDDDPITPSIVIAAFRDLGISALRKAIADMPDAGAAMLSLIRIAGCGVEVDVTLPRGTDTAEIQRKRRKLAENLGRHEHEVFITIPAAARTVRLWIADTGALDEPIGPSPLVLDPDMVADVYTGRAPWGQDLRGDVALIALLQRHLLITGLSNQGKTAALRALVLWLALDPTAEFRIADLKGVGDWRMFDGLATTLIQGPTDEHVIAATEMLEDGVREMEKRIKALEASGATDGVTRDMARKPGGGFHPIFLTVDEAQVAFMCPAVGDDKRPYGGTKATSRYFLAARKLHNQGRAVNVILYQGTQDPTDQNLPKLVREGAHIRASLVVGTEEQARMALGDKAVNGGAAPHKLRQGLDKGVVVVAGDGVPLPAGQASITIRTHFVDGAAAAEIAERAKRRRAAVTTRTGAELPARNALADVATVMEGRDRVRSAEVLQQLTERWPEHYRGWSAQQLAAALGAAGVTIRSGRLDGKAGQRYVSGDDVLDALDDQAEQDEDTLAEA